MNEKTEWQYVFNGSLPQTHKIWNRLHHLNIFKMIQYLNIGRNSF